MTAFDPPRFFGPVILFSSLLFFMGCGRSANKNDRRATPPKTPLPPDVVVEVDGKALSREYADMETRYRLQTLESTVLPEQRFLLEQEVKRRVAEQFIAKTLLAQEAEKRGFKASDEDMDQAYERVQSQLPPGQTLENMIWANPARARKMREDMVNGVVINKLLESLPKDALTVAQDEVDAFYKNIRRARHILIKVDKDAPSNERAEKKGTAEHIRQQLDQGKKTFDELAVRHSDCPSKQRGGYLGHFPKGQMAPEFDRAVFSQAIGEIGPVVETSFGYHIVQVLENDIKDSGPLAEDHVRRELLRTKRAASIDAFVEKLKRNAVIRYAPDYGGRNATDDGRSNRPP